MKYFICGFTGAGKSYLLKELENSHQLPHFQFFDLDLMIDQEYAIKYRNLADFINTVGFDHFRELEVKKIIELNSMNNIVVALGGGALNRETREIFDRNGWRGFWLNTDFPLCVERIKNDENRPLSRLSEDELWKLYKEREIFYNDYQEVWNMEQVLKIIMD